MTSQEFKNLLKDDHLEHFSHIFDLQETAPVNAWGGTQRGTSRREQNLISLLCEMKMKSSSPVVRPAEAGRGSPRMRQATCGRFPTICQVQIKQLGAFPDPRLSNSVFLFTHSLAGRGGVRTTSVDLVSRRAFCALVSERVFFFSR